MKKNIAIVVTRLDLGGAQKVALALFEKLDRKKFNVHLIAGKGGLLDKQIADYGLRAAGSKYGANIQLWDEIKHPISPLNDIKASLKLAGYFRENKIEIVNTHSSKAGILGRLAAGLAGIKDVYHTVHGFSFHENQNPFTHSLYRITEWAFAPYTKKFIAVGRDVIAYGTEKGVGQSAQYALIRAAVDTAFFRKKRKVRADFLKKYGLIPGNFTVGMIGNLKKQKNPEEFVKIAALACAADRKIQFILAGGGNEKDHGRISGLIRRFEIGSRVKLAGWINNPGDFMSSIDVFLLTSLWEGLPCTLVQAYCAGIPSVATDIPGNSEFVKLAASGVLYAPGNPREAVLRIMELKNKTIRPSAGLLAEFDEKRMVKQYEQEFLGK